MTGLYSHTHKVVDNSAPLTEGLTFFPEYLQDAGYKTGFFGKWHMGNDSGETQPGFNHQEAFKGQGEYYNPRININGIWKQYEDSTYVTDLLTEHAIDFIKEQVKSDKPFFVYLSHKGVHGNFHPAKRHKGCYTGKKLVIPESYNSPYYGIKQLPSVDPKTGKPARGKEYYGENMHPDWVKNQRESWHGVRTERYKYIRYYGICDTNEFYDLQEHPYETQKTISVCPLYEEYIKAVRPSGPLVSTSIPCAINSNTPFKFPFRAA